MARLFVILLTVALFVTGRLAHAAPSKGEEFWRAVLPGAAVPDAILSLLHPDNHFISKAKTEGSGDLDRNKGSSNHENPLWIYQDNKHSSSTPADVHTTTRVGDSGGLDSNHENPLWIYQDNKHSSATPADDHTTTRVGDSGGLDGNHENPLWIYQDHTHSSATPADDHTTTRVGDSRGLDSNHENPLWIYQDHRHSSTTPADDHTTTRVGDSGGLNNNHENPLWIYQDNKHSSATSAGDHTAAEARDSGGLDSNKGSSNRKWLFYRDHDHSSATPAEDHTAAEMRDSGDHSKRHHHVGAHVAVSASQGSGAATTTTVFFHAELLRVGARLFFDFPATVPAALGFLPRTVADSIPFATDTLPQALTLFGVSPGSAMAATMANTLRACELPSLSGEARFCATSLEGLVERAMAAMGTQDIRAVTSSLPSDGAPLQLYTIRAVRPVEGASFVACHYVDYPYTVYGCHGTGPARAYMMKMEGADGSMVTVASICHTDTSQWTPDHIAFKVLGTKPGGAPVCHVMPYGDIIWAKKPKVSPA